MDQEAEAFQYWVELFLRSWGYLAVLDEDSDTHLAGLLAGLQLVHVKHQAGTAPDTEIITQTFPRSQWADGLGHPPRPVFA